MDDTYRQQFLNNFLNFIFLGKGVMIRESIGRKTPMDKWDGMIMGVMGRRNPFGILKNKLVFVEDKLDVEMNIA
jgi:hypothetical protein